jgi:hypothetical protein
LNKKDNDYNTCHHPPINHGNFSKKNSNFINEIYYVDKGIQKCLLVINGLSHKMK